MKTSSDIHAVFSYHAFPMKCVKYLAIWDVSDIREYKSTLTMTVKHQNLDPQNDHLPQT